MIAEEVDQTAVHTVNAPAGFPLEALEMLLGQKQGSGGGEDATEFMGAVGLTRAELPGGHPSLSQQAVIISIVHGVPPALKDLDLKLVLWGSLSPAFLVTLSSLPDI